MNITQGFNQHIIIDLTEGEAVEFRRWLDHKNEEIDEFVEEMVDKLFDLTYTPLRDAKSKTI